jgi:hypothetical protein
MTYAAWLLSSLPYSGGSDAFVCEQPAFSIETAGIARQFSICADHAMARDDYRNRVLGIGEPDGACG